MADHPRVGGEHDSGSLTLARINGSSPRGRGTRTSRNHCRLQVGSSPRGRGTPLQYLSMFRPIRIIPAWAGNALPRMAVSSPVTDHPRVGGEHPASPLRILCSIGSSRVGGEHGLRAGVASLQVGSSPRGRGTRITTKRGGDSDRIIPAWAGNTGGVGRQNPPEPDHPRVGGEHSFASQCAVTTAGSSPRGRGTREAGQVGSSPRGRGTRRGESESLRARRIIPAWAGNTISAHSAASSRSDHPRVGGEHFVWLDVKYCTAGSSPLRGTRLG